MPGERSDGPSMVADRTAQGVAVIGIAARLPGAPDIDSFWANLCAGHEAIARLSDAELRAAGFAEAEIRDPGFVRAYGVLEDIDAFDAGFFGYPRARAEVLDPQQRILLECAWTALEHAGYAPGTVSEAVGVYLSIAQGTYRPEAAAEDAADGFFALTSADKDYAATRISYKLGLTGPSMMVQTACSGSLAALHTAVEALLAGQCDMAIAGGCTIGVPQGGYRHREGLMLSRNGVCRAFDAAAEGAVPGNGAAVVVLKPLDAAIADNDTIYCVVRGSALNNDGALKTDYLAPSVAGQARVIAEALTVAEIPADSIGYVEAHGTGTRLGDPIEIRALTRAYRHFTERRQFCQIGSVKTNIGHLNVASGIVGFVKAALAVYHGAIPPSLHFSEANSDIDFAATPFSVARTLREWKPAGGPRRAAISSFGFGGTNVHVIIEEPPTAARAAAEGAVLLPVSAKSAAGLDIAAENLARFIEQHADGHLADLAYTLQVGRQAFGYRRAVVCRTSAEAVAQLRTGRDGAVAPVPGSASLVRPPAPAATVDDLSSLARQWQQGATIDWASLHVPSARRRIAAPTYPFQRDRYWSHRTASANEPGPMSHPVPAPATAAATEAGLLVWLIGLFAAEIREDAASLDPDATFDRFGIDSLLVVSLTGKIAGRFPGIRSTLLFEQNTLRRLASHLAPLGAESPAAPPPAAVSATQAETIAIVGLAGRYPGAGDLAAFWDNLREGRSGIREVPESRWNWRTYFDPDNPGKSYTRWAGFIDDVDRFDPLFFGIAPREAKLLDPQQRVFLQTVWAALEDAGTTRAGLKDAAQRANGADVGVFVGVMNTGYRLAGLAAAEAGHVVQANQWSVANRVSYLFDFSGPSLAVDTACSASLTALHLAVESLRRGECGAAITGGVNLILHPVQQLELCRMGMLSHGDRCHAFGAGADGFIQGEGVGAAVLKPLAAALADGDQIYGVILGSAINADGRTAGYTVPSPRAQAKVIAAAMARAGIAASTITYVECHGTGTALGDPIEVSGLADAFAQDVTAAGACAIGSVKSNIGHLESAAGIASLSKVLLQMRHQTLAPSLNTEELNPRIDFASTRFHVQRIAEPWQRTRDVLNREQPRRAGISGFGAGGANAHVIVEEAPAPYERAPEPVRPCLVPLSARTPEALRLRAEHLRDHLGREGGALAPDRLRDLAYTLSVGREAMEVRTAFLAEDARSLIAELGSFVSSGSSQPPLGETPLADLARRWCAGGEVDWSTLYAGEARRRVSLPTYPFAREHCWLPSVEATTPGTRGSVIPPGTPQPTLLAEARWVYELHPDDPAVRGHRVGGRPTLPGVSVLEMALSCARQLGVTTIVAIEQVFWLRPVVVAAPLRITLTLRDSDDRLVFELANADGDIFSRGRLRTSGAVGPAPVIDIAAVAARCGQVMKAGAFYQRLEELGLSYDDNLRAVETVRAGASEAFATVALPHVASGDECILHPALQDAALQTAALISFQKPGALRMLPFALERLDILAPLPARGIIHARLLSDPSHPDVSRYEVMVADEQGVPALRLHDLSGRPDLRSAAKTADEWFYVPTWSACPVERTVTQEPAGPNIIFAEQADPLASVLAARTPQGTERLPLHSTEGAERNRLLARASRIWFVVPRNEISTQPAAVLTLLGILRALKAESGALRPISLTVIAVQGLDVVPGERGAPHAAACFALARVAAKECPAWHVRCLDLGGEDEAVTAMADPGDPLGREVAYRSGHRLTRVLLPHTPVSGVPAFRWGGCYLILGGAGGIGLAFAEHLVKTYRARLVLVGRSVLSAERAAAIEQLRRYGGDVTYLRADATDAGALRSAVRTARDQFGRIEGAIHAAIVMEDRGLDRMDDATFRTAYDAKVLTSVHLADALSDDPPDWLALFSSANSFAANSGQANYVAGCAFKDAFARALAARVPFRIRIINWGFWGEIGRVATPAYRARLARLGVTPIATVAGIEAAERIIAGEALQVLALKAAPEVLQSLGMVAAAPKVAAAMPVSDAMQQVVTRLTAYADRHASAMAGATDEYQALDHLAQRRFARWWRDAELAPADGSVMTREALWQRIHLAPRHGRQADALLDIAERMGLVEAAPGGWRRGADTGDLSDATLAAECSAFRTAHPSFVPHLDLLDLCLAEYTEVLAGRSNATAILFPDLSMSRVEAMYRGNRVVDYNNGAVAEAVAALAATRVGAGSPVRVLEFGAGTGGTSHDVLAALAATGVPAEYVYTDVSRGFTQHGQRRFGARYPFLRFRPLDIEKDPIAQGFVAGEHDIILGANVIHATASLDRSLAHLQRLLTPDGALVLYEMTARHDFVTLTFGLLDGWWKAEDQRLPHTPLLDTQSWQAMLAASGFGEVRLFGEPGLTNPRDFRHSVIVALRPAAAAVAAKPVAAASPSSRGPLLRIRLGAAAKRSASAQEPQRSSIETVSSDRPDRITALRDCVAMTVATTLEMRVSDLRHDRTFSEYGADSILSVDLVAALNGRLGIELKPTVLFSYPTVQALAAHIQDRYAARIAKSLSHVANQAPGASNADHAPDDNTAARLRASAHAAGTSGSSMLQRETFDRPRPIAVIGMAGRFPGADDLSTFWRNLSAGTDSVGEVPAERWNHAAIYDADPLAPNRTNCRHGGFLSDIASFDPLFFNLSPAEATAMDPQQRLFLQEAWHALENAGYSDTALAGHACGVFVGTVGGDYDDRLRDAGYPEDARSFMGNAPSMLAARIAYHLDLRGPSLSIDTACSSSLVAVHMACESLRRGECDMALAGGVAAMTTARFYNVAAKAGMLSPSGRCRTLDSGADGFVPAEGVGVVVLKDLEKARADGDHIHGVIIGSGINQDGASNGITAPNARAQAELERAVYRRAGVRADTISYVELHGTGTRLGDPMEIEALTDAFADSKAGPGTCAIGSVKSNIGHTLAAAGVAGLIKVLLALAHRSIPPTLHLDAINPHIDLSAGPFHAPVVAVPWTRVSDEVPLRGAVSSFGFSGTNAHLVVQEAPLPLRKAKSSPGWNLATVSARTERALVQSMRDLAGWLRASGNAADFDDVCATLNAGRSHFGWRAAFIVRDPTTLAEALEAAVTKASERHETPHGNRHDAAGFVSLAQADDRQGLEWLRSAYIRGERVDWSALYPVGTWHRVPLAAYPFEQRRCWPSEAVQPAVPRTDTPRPSLLQAVAARLDRAATRQAVAS